MASVGVIEKALSFLYVQSSCWICVVRKGVRFRLGRLWGISRISHLTSSFLFHWGLRCDDGAGWSAKWRTGLLLNIKDQTLNSVSAPQGTPTNALYLHFSFSAVPLYSSPFSRLLKKKTEGIHCFPGLLCCLRQCPREKLWRRKKLDSAVFEKYHLYFYTGCLYLLIDGDNFSEEVAQQRLETGLPSESPSALLL